MEQEERLYTRDTVVWPQKFSQQHCRKLSLKSCSFGLKPLSFTRQVNRVWCGLGDRAFPSCMCSEFEIVRCFTWLSYTIGQIVFFLFICLNHFCLACWCQDEVRICLMAKAFVSAHGICVDQITLKNRKH